MFSDLLRNSLETLYMLVKDIRAGFAIIKLSPTTVWAYQAVSGRPGLS